MKDFVLSIETDPQDGQLLSLRDPALGMDILNFRRGAEFELNGRQLPVRLISQQGAGAEHITAFDISDASAYMAGRRFELRRMITVGGHGLHTGRSNSVHIRYHLRRVPCGDWRNEMDMPWGAPLESPLFVETISALGAPAAWFGPKTRMRAVAVGGSGPREHVSYDDGPLAEVTTRLQTAFRSAFPGQMTIPGALYYHPADERFVWVIVRRPATGGRIRFAPDRQAFEFAYFRPLKVHDEIVTPEISIYWGRGLAEAERIAAAQFDRFEEPPDWWFKTVWFWLHPMWQKDATFRQCEEAVRILADECGVTGFGLGIHDIPASGRDIDPASPLPSPCMGGEDGMKRLCDTIQAKGGHSYIWCTRTGLFPNGALRDSWRIRGEDGRKLSIRPPAPEQAVQLDMVCNADTSYRNYMYSVVEHYVRDLGVTGFFWDSGAQPMPPDFTPRPELDYPGQAMTAPVSFYEDIYRFGRRLSPDFFMWFEGISTELRSNAFAMDSKTHGALSGHRLMHRLAHAGPRRLVWRSAWTWDVAGAFPFIDPVSDICRDPGPATYREIAADPVNRLLCKIVRERGCRQAEGVADGMSLLDEYLIAGNGATGAADIPVARCPAGRLRNAVTGQTLRGRAAGKGLWRFNVPSGGIWEMIR